MRHWLAMKRILIVDDEKSIRESLTGILQDEGFSPYSVESGEAVLARISDEKPDLILLDIWMPGMDGLEVCKKLRQKSNIPIIMLTAASDDLDRILGLELGSDDYMGKPFNPRELLARIKALVRRSEVKEEDVDNNIVMNYAARSAFVNGEELDLTGGVSIKSDGGGGSALKNRIELFFPKKLLSEI